MKPPLIVRAENDQLFDAEGRAYVDLFSAHGAAWLGHRPESVSAALRAQLERVWLVGRLPTPPLAEATARLEGFFPPSHGLCALYSTGMEAGEFALRLARVTTGRPAVLGFEGSTHGKSFAMARLGWDDALGFAAPGLERLPFLPRASEEEALRFARERLARRDVAAIFVEPILGSGGGHAASADFHRELRELCSEAGTLLVFDEILTGFHRTGPVFVHRDLGVVPDVVLLGKALGAGFPVSAVVAERRHALKAEMLPWSTYAGNPLAASAVVASLDAMHALELRKRVAVIEETVLRELAPLRGTGVEARGRGALWVLTLPAALDAGAVVTRAFARGVALGYAGAQIRVLPAATVDPARLAAAVGILVEEIGAS